MKLFKRTLSVILSFLIVFSTFGLCLSFQTSAAATPILSVEDKTVAPGDQFTVAVSLNNATSVYDGNFTLQYDSSLLTIDSYSFGSIISGHTKNCNTNYQSAGNLIRLTFSGSESTGSGGTLVTFTFTAKASGTATLQFSAYKMYDMNGSSLTTTANSGTVTILPAPQPSSPGLTIENKTVTVGDQFSVPVVINNASSVYDGNFTLQYDSSLLTIDSYSFGSIISGHTKNCNTNYQSAGNLIRLTFSGSEAIGGGGTLVTFTFTAKASGTANLQFNAYKMYDMNGSSITTTANGGTVKISPAPQPSSPGLTIENKTVTVGDQFSVPVVINNASSVYDGNFTLQYDSSLLTVDSYSFGSIISGHTKNCNTNYQSAGNLIRLTFSGSESVGSGGTLVTFTFTAKASGTANLQFNAYKMYDMNGSSIDTTVSNGVVSITKPIDITKPTVLIASTNNVTTSQTATLTMSDTVGVVSYYWGTNSTPANSSFTTITSATSKTVEKTVSDSGTYYLIAKDAAGNTAITSVTFYKTTLNANGGSVTPTSIITKSGNTVTLPTPTRSGYAFNGWSTSSSATSGVTFVTVSSNSTYYAVWSYIDSTKPTVSISSTNNVASSQTATLTISDNVGVVSYYWGTSSSPASSSFTTITSATSKTVEKTVTDSGTYYMVAKDAAGNIATTSVTFYKTTLNANGGSVTPTSIITKSGYAVTLPTATRTGYVFDSWASSSSATSGGVTTIMPSSNYTYYAVWSYIDLTNPVVSVSSTNNVASSQTATLTMSDDVGVASYYWGTSSSPTSSSFTTITSATSKTVEKPVSDSGTYYLIAKDAAGNTATTSVTFYETTLDANGGSVTISSILTQSGNTIYLPSATIDDRYTFEGWGHTPTDTVGISSVTVTSNNTYYAVWKFIPPEIEGELVEIEMYQYPQTTFYVGDSFNRRNLVLTERYSSGFEAWVIRGYTTSFDDVGTLLSPGTFTVVVYYHELSIEYKIKVLPTEVVLSKDNIILECGKTQELTATCTPETLDYFEWKSSNEMVAIVNNGMITAVAPGTAEIYVYFIYGGCGATSKPCVVTVNEDTKPTVSISSTNNVESSQTVTLTISDNVGVVSYYWGTNSTPANSSFTTITSATSKTVEKTVSDSGTYYLIAKDAAGNTAITSVTFYKTTLDANSGNVTPTNIITKSGNTVSLPTATRSGYTFNGWSISSAATSGSTTITVSSNKTYYATWCYIDSTDPTVSISSTNNVASSQIATLTMSDKVGVVSYYWGTSSSPTSSSFTTITSATSKTVEKPVSDSGTYYLIAKDAAGNTATTSITFYKTTLNANGGSVTPTSIITKNGNTVTLPTPTRDGYEFKGWATASTDNSGKETIEPVSDDTYYAVWEVDSESVTALLGDVNGDGKVNVKDATLIQKAAASLVMLDDVANVCADVNGDGKVNVKDATAIQKYAASLETGFAIGEEIKTKVA